ncbi:MAG: hypothetical protein ACR2OW_00285 [Methyloligellaceae bacterium]
MTETRAESATILLVIDSAGVNGARWDLGKGADLVLCISAGCYVSAGSNEPANFLKGKRALVRGPRAGNCNNSVHCIFRNVDLPRHNPVVRPVDVDAVEHDYMEALPAKIDRTCELKGAGLKCEKAIHTVEYSLWIVPETVAEKASVEVLEDTLYFEVRKSIHRQPRRHVSNGSEPVMVMNLR